MEEYLGSRESLQKLYEDQHILLNKTLKGWRNTINE